MSKARGLAAAAAALLAVAALDLATGDISVSIFYLIPISLATWTSGLGWGLALAVVAAAVELALEPIVAPDSHTAAVYWDDAMKGVVFLAFVVLLAKLRGALLRERALSAELDRRVQDRTALLQAANDELQSFNYALAHHLRGPLRAVASHGRALEVEFAQRLAPEQKERFARLQDGVGRLDALIEGLLLITSLPAARPRRDDVDVSALAREAAQAMARAQPERRVSCAIADGLRCRGDRKLLAAALKHLLANAWKFTAGRDPARVEVGSERAGPEPVFFVRDDGIGFDMAYAGKLFEPFQRLHGQREAPGLGIGLALAQRIVARHGGRMWAQGSPGRGATFYFTVP